MLARQVIEVEVPAAVGADAAVTREQLRVRQRRRLAGESVPSRYELRLQLGDGTVRWIGLSVAVVPWDGGSATLTFFADIVAHSSVVTSYRDALFQ